MDTPRFVAEVEKADHDISHMSEVLKNVRLWRDYDAYVTKSRKKQTLSQEELQTCTAAMAVALLY